MAFSLFSASLPSLLSCTSKTFPCQIVIILNYPQRKRGSMLTSLLYLPVKLCPPNTDPTWHCCSVGLFSVPFVGRIWGLLTSISRSHLALLSTSALACFVLCLFIVDEKEVTSVLLLPLTHFGCGQRRSLFVTIKSHTGTAPSVISSCHFSYRNPPTGLCSVS